MPNYSAEGFCGSDTSGTTCACCSVHKARDRSDRSNIEQQRRSGWLRTLNKSPLYIAMVYNYVCRSLMLKLSIGFISRINDRLYVLET